MRHRIAGGETVATFLAATTYYLVKDGPTTAYRKLCEEIRERYKSEAEIDASSAQQLLYLQAVINEGLRIYPPGSQGFPRLSPGQVIDGHWVPKGVSLTLCLSNPRHIQPARADIDVVYIDRSIHQRLDRDPRRAQLPRAHAIQA